MKEQPQQRLNLLEDALEIVLQGSKTKQLVITSSKRDGL